MSVRLPTPEEVEMRRIVFIALVVGSVALTPIASAGGYTYTIVPKALAANGDLIALKAGGTFYPQVQDGYYDTMCLKETITPKPPFGFERTVRVYRESGQQLRVSASIRDGHWCWSGRTESGEKAPVGTYEIVSTALIYDDEQQDSGTKVVSNRATVRIATGYRKVTLSRQASVTGAGSLLKEKTRQTFRGNCGFQSGGIYCRPGSAHPWWKLATHDTTTRVVITAIRGKCYWPSSQPQPDCFVAVRKDLPSVWVVGTFDGYGSMITNRIDYTEWWVKKVKI